MGKFAAVDVDRVDAVAEPSTGREFLVVGEDETFDVEHEGTDVMERGMLEKLVEMSEYIRDAPQEVKEAFSVLGEFAKANENGKKDEDDYGYPPPKREKRSSLLAAAFPVREITRSWFEDPKLNEPTPLTVTDEGRVFGHIALWGTCHIGLQGDCVMPPRSGSSYAFFRTGVKKVDGVDIPVGQITMGTGHADKGLDATMAAAHYDNTGTSVADVAAGEDEYGIWVAGAVRKGTTLEQVETLRASAPSGDWRAIGGRLDLVGVLAVNVPGFPIPRSLAASAYGYDSDGNLVTVIATGKQGVDPVVAEWMSGVEEKLESIDKALSVVRPVVASVIRSRVGLDATRAIHPGKKDDEDEDEDENNKERAKNDDDDEEDEGSKASRAGKKDDEDEEDEDKAARAKKNYPKPNDNKMKKAKDDEDEEEEENGNKKKMRAKDDKEDEEEEENGKKKRAKDKKNDEDDDEEDEEG